MDFSCLLPGKEQFRRRFIKHRVPGNGVYDITVTGRGNQRSHNRRVDFLESIMHLIEIVEADSLHTFRCKLTRHRMIVCSQMDLRSEERRVGKEGRRGM